MENDARAPTPDPRMRRTILFGGMLIAACLLGWLQWRAYGSTQDTYAAALRQLNQMRTDAGRIKAQRHSPQAAVSRTRPNEELLGQVEQALSAAGIDRGKWHDSIPQPLVRLPKSDYKRLATRLYFEAVTLKRLAAFAHHLRLEDPTLRVSAVNLINRNTESPEFDVDLAVSYLVFAPREGDSR